MKKPLSSQSSITEVINILGRIFVVLLLAVQCAVVAIVVLYGVWFHAGRQAQIVFFALFSISLVCTVVYRRKIMHYLWPKKALVEAQSADSMVQTAEEHS